MTELKERVAGLEKEAATAKKEVVAAIRRGEKAEEKEQAVAKQEEEQIPRVEALVNSLSGKCFLPLFPI